MKSSKTTLATLVALGAALLAISAPAGSAAPGATSQTGDASLRASEFAKGVRKCINRERVQRDIPKLGANSVLNKAAQYHANRMVKLDFFDHIGPDGDTPEDRVEMFNDGQRITYIGENIAAGGSTPKATCAQWMNSSGHKANILREEFEIVGGGFARGGDYGKVWVAVFAKG